MWLYGQVSHRHSGGGDRALGSSSHSLILFHLISGHNKRRADIWLMAIIVPGWRLFCDGMTATTRTRGDREWGN